MIQVTGRRPFACNCEGRLDASGMPVPDVTGTGGELVALREFADDRGRVWQVCDVQPTYIERRSGGERRVRPRPDSVERRQRRQHRMVVPPRFRSGWLVFETRSERRRLGPIPPGWDEWGEQRLLMLLRDAEVLRSSG